MAHISTWELAIAAAAWFWLYGTTIDRVDRELKLDTGFAAIFLRTCALVPPFHPTRRWIGYSLTRLCSMILSWVLLFELWHRLF